MTDAGPTEDLSRGWEASANEFIAVADPHIGAETVARWSSFLQSGNALLDVGCGFGGTYTRGLIDKGVDVYGIDAAPTLLREYQERFPEVTVCCEAAEQSPFFHRTFDAVVCIGLVFLLPAEDQELVLRKMAKAVKIDGRLLFTSPRQVCDWDDLLTGRRSVSLGRAAYVHILQEQGLHLVSEYSNEGQNHYYNFQKGEVP